MRFGAYSLLLGVAAINGVFLATLLLLRGGRHRGSVWLALLTVTIALRLMPYILGFAGAYDLHPALTFAPFDLSLAWGPLLWLYVEALSNGTERPRWPMHLVPAAVQLLYQLIAFALPRQKKLDWYTGPHLDVIEPAGSLLVLISLAAYGFAAWRCFNSWQSWLDANLSNREETRLGWLRAILAGFGITGAIGAVLVIAHVAFGPLDYFARMPVIGALAVLSYLIALLGYRHGGEAIPITLTEVQNAEPIEEAPAESIDSRSRGKDYAAEARAWRQRVVGAGWHRDAGLTATKLADLLGTSPRSLSRTLNEGLGESFNDFVNRVRVEEAVGILARPGSPDVLRVAFEVGFASKASFNRAFRRHTGATPTVLRSGFRSETSQDTPF